MSLHKQARRILKDVQATTRPNQPDSSSVRFARDGDHLMAVYRATSGRGFPIAPIRYPK